MAPTATTMANPSKMSLLKSSFGIKKALVPFYTGGPVVVSQDAKILATTVDDAVHLVSLDTAQPLTVIKGVNCFYVLIIEFLGLGRCDVDVYCTR